MVHRFLQIKQLIQASGDIMPIFWGTFESRCEPPALCGDDFEVAFGNYGVYNDHGFWDQCDHHYVFPKCMESMSLRNGTPKLCPEFSSVPKAHPLCTVKKAETWSFIKIAETILKGLVT